MRLAVCALLVLLAPLAHGRPVRPHVYLVIVDGLGADELDAALMPRTVELARGDGALRTEAAAAMPTRTNPNHVTLLSGLAPEAHGVTGNGYWDRRARTEKPLDAAASIEAETLFTVAETARPAFVTMAAFSKAKLGHLFAALPGRQHAPDVLWTPEAMDAGHVTGVAGDVQTMDAFLAAAAEREPDLVAINLSEVDRTAHAQGPSATADARRHADAAVGRLVDDLVARGRWHRSIVVVTADHGFDGVAPTPSRPSPSVVLSAKFAEAGITGVHVVADGGTAHVYADDVSPTATRAGASTAVLGWAAAVAWRDPSVADVIARLPLPNVPTLAHRHPDWGLQHERAGDLIVVANEGYAFVDATDNTSPTFRGNHGSPREMRVPLIIAGGALTSPAPTVATPPTSADVGATIASLLNLRPPRRFDGRPVQTGRAIKLNLREEQTSAVQ
jgi:arylsulfatase A-like enzyme